MELRKVMKSLVALGTGATLVGATVLSALAAADLSQYPKPLFIQDGAFDALIVVGANAKAEDTLGAIDISTSLQAANTVTKTVPGTSTTVTVEGDAFRLDQGSDFVEKTEAINAVGTTTLTKNELDALAGGKLTNAKGSFNYEETITVANAAADFDVDPDDTASIPAWFLKFNNAANAYVYKMTFTPGLESDIDSNRDLDDLDLKAITLLGMDYNIVDTYASTVSTTDLQGTGEVRIDFMAGASSDTISVGETKTYQIGDADYEVTLTYVNIGVAKFTVNGVATNQLAAGETDVLSDGTEIGLSEVLYQGYAGGTQSASFYLGATKIRFRDTDVTATTTGDQKVIVGSNTVTDVTATIAGDNATSGIMKINTITLTWLADEDYYIPIDGKLSDKQDDDQMFMNFDVEFKGLQEDTDTEDILLTSSGDDEYRMKFYNKAGDLLEIPLWDVDTTTLNFGNENYRLVVAEANATDWVAGDGTYNGTITKNDYFVVSDASGKNTYLLRYSGSDTTDKTITFQNVAANTEHIISYTGWANMETSVATLTLGGVDFPVFQAADANNAHVAVSLDADATLEPGAIPTWWTKYGANITLAGTNSALGFDFTSEGGDDTVTTGGETVRINTTVTSDTIELGQIKTGDESFLQTIGDTNNKEDYLVWGTKFYQTYAESGPDKLTITYPDDQTEMLVYYTSGATTSSTTSGGSTYEEVVPINVDAAVLDTEVTDFSAQNLIIVGGPCVNTAAADIMENPDPCTTGFEEGKAMIKLYERTDGKVALLVAGYVGMDTRRAARALAEYDQHTFTGTELEVTGTSLTQYTVSTPVTE